MKIRSFALAMLAAVALFNSCQSTTSKRLVGETWRLVEYQGAPFEGNNDNYMIIFSADMTLSGVADCNSLVSDYTLDEGNKIEVTNKALTRAMCQNDEMERKFLELLESVESYEIKGSKLYWRGKDSQLGVFEAIE